VAAGAVIEDLDAIKMAAFSLRQRVLLTAWNSTQSAGEPPKRGKSRPSSSWLLPWTCPGSFAATST